MQLTIRMTMTTCVCYELTMMMRMMKVIPSQITKRRKEGNRIFPSCFLTTLCPLVLILFSTFHQVFFLASKTHFFPWETVESSFSFHWELICKSNCVTFLETFVVSGETLY